MSHTWKDTKHGQVTETSRKESEGSRRFSQKAISEAWSKADQLADQDELNGSLSDEEIRYSAAWNRIMGRD